MKAWIELFQAEPVACTFLTIGVLAGVVFMWSLRRMR